MDTLSSTAPATTPSTSRPRAAALVAAAVVGAGVVNALIAVAFRAGGVSHDFRQLTPAIFLPLTVIGVLVGALGWALVRRLARRPAATLRWLVPAVLVLSFIPDVLVLSSGSLPGSSAAAVLALALMHVATVAVAVPLYRRAMPVS